MKVAQIYEIMNNVTSEILGKTDLIAEDLSNVVEVGTEIMDATSYDNYVRSLVDHVGRVVFVNRPYRGAVPSVLMDGWEFGSVMEKISMASPTAEEDATWALTDGQVYEQDKFIRPNVTVKFFNDRVTFTVPISITERQVKNAFSNAEQLNGFISMIYNAVDRSMTIKVDALVMRTINAFTARVLHEGKPTQRVNLLAGYNATAETKLTAANCIKNSHFIRYVAEQMGLYIDRLKVMSTLFNAGGKERFTPSDLLHVVLLSDLAKAADVYEQSDAFHDELSRLPQHETVPYWQASGAGYSFDSVSKIHVTLTDEETPFTVEQEGILGVMFDRDALGVTCYDRRTTAHRNERAEFTNLWHKSTAGYFNDLDENFIVFYVADGE